MMLNPSKLAKRWGVSTTMIYDLLNSGKLPGFRLGGKLWRIKLEDVEAYEARPLPEPITTPGPNVNLAQGEIPPELIAHRTEQRLRKLAGEA